ncbi:hypothetical protein H5410_057890 [Solanum commersonii]|uniref:Uncharacterized protein n=1 Tax=Solanum commersonii TaxID=4109 RepID=A0A9J5WRI5_SOLCO|nr:hypothetical protein H5410_057890 [Solanum commersonii]
MAHSGRAAECVYNPQFQVLMYSISVTVNSILVKTMMSSATMAGPRLCLHGQQGGRTEKKLFFHAKSNQAPKEIKVHKKKLQMQRLPVNVWHSQRIMLLFSLLFNNWRSTSHGNQILSTFSLHQKD